MQSLWEDLHYGLRMLGRNRGFTAVALLTLALGIGATTALFSVVNGVLLNPLPFPKAARLVALYESRPNFERGSISYPNYLDWQKENGTFEAMAAYRQHDFDLTGTGGAELVHGEQVSSNLFSVLGVEPDIGRTFTLQEDQLGAESVVMLSARIWKRKFGGSRNVLGKRIVLDGTDYTIIGVVPAGFHLGIEKFRDKTDVYVPVGQEKTPFFRERQGAFGLGGMGLLKPGVTIEQARADMDRVMRDLRAAYPQDNKGTGANVIALKQEMVGDVQTPLLVLLGAVGCVLLIACVNVANLLLARSTGRAREFAIRAALGATRGRVVRQLLTESLTLSICGGALGLIVGAWGTKAALGLLPQELPRAEGIGLDGRVLLFALLISAASGIIFGLAPALKTSRPDLQESLKDGSRGSSGGQHHARGLLVAGETAMALVLLIGAGLMIRSLGRLWGVNPGFHPRNVLTFRVSPPPSLSGRSPDAIRAAYRELMDKFRAVPGVKAVALSSSAKPLEVGNYLQFWPAGQPKPASVNDMNLALDFAVTPDYLDVMGIALEHGRFFTPNDDARSAYVVVVDDVLAREYFHGQDALGKRIHLEGYNIEAEIVGIVGHVKVWGLDSDDTNTLRAQMYISLLQLPDNWMPRIARGTGVFVRVSGAQPAVLTSIREASARMSSEQVISGEETEDEIVANSLATRRFSMILLGVFAALALLLASMGTYGVLAYFVGERSHEIGIRVALGAQRSDVLWLVIGEGLKMALAGVAVGIAGALAATQLLSSLLYGVTPTDPGTFAGVTILLTLVAVAASCLPARRAMRLDPMVALRHE